MSLVVYVPVAVDAAESQGLREASLYPAPYCLGICKLMHFIAFLSLF